MKGVFYYFKNIYCFLLLGFFSHCIYGKTFGQLGTPEVSHNYVYRDYFSYETWDFCSYEKRSKNSFLGYLYGDVFSTNVYLNFFPKEILPKFDRHKLIPLKNKEIVLDEHVPEIKAESQEKKIPVEKKDTPLIVSTEENAIKKISIHEVNTSLNEVNNTKTPIAPEDIILFLKKQIPNSPNNSQNNKLELLVPFEVPHNVPNYPSVRSKATFIQE